MKPGPGIYVVGLLFAAVAVAVAAGRSGPVGNTVVSPTPEPVLRGQRVFTENCAMCHGDAGQGNGELAPMLTRRAGAYPANIADPARLRRLGMSGVRRVVTEGGAHTGRSNLMPAWAGRLTARQIDDVSAFVMSLPNSPVLAVAKAREEFPQGEAGTPQRGAILFQHHCAACHGTQGKGDGTFAPALMAKHDIRPRNLTDPVYLSRKSDRDLYATIKLGGGHMGKSPYMPVWGGYLQPSQIRDLVSYVRVLSHTATRE
jgi:mono/diheme cytochrome c family protein